MRTHTLSLGNNLYFYDKLRRALGKPQESLHNGLFIYTFYATFSDNSRAMYVFV